MTVNTMDTIEIHPPKPPPEPKYASNRKLLVEIESIIVHYAKILFFYSYNKKVCSVCLDTTKNNKVFRKKKYREMSRYKCRTCIGLKSKSYDYSENRIFMNNCKYLRNDKPYLQDVVAQLVSKTPSLNQSPTFFQYMLDKARQDWYDCQDKDIYIEKIKKDLIFDLDTIRESKYQYDIEKYQKQKSHDQEEYERGIKKLEVHMKRIMYS